MLHPSYTDLMDVVNAGVEEGEEPIVSSRYSIVLATAKRARQIIDGSEPLVYINDKKPLSTAVEELNSGAMKILNHDEVLEAMAEEAIEENAQETAASEEEA
ncbi:MAG: DNA-directed RNA polymerase subunit omega [Lachnospiraceae bacterium]|nr:DNA-directed RNA polymerase subunit omega [Lachnospiraceae bacterium]